MKYNNDEQVFVSIDIRRYNELLAAEDQLNSLKRLIQFKEDRYESIDQKEIRVLCALYGIKEDVDVREDNENGCE